MLVNLRVLLGRLVDIVLLRAGPESLPASTPLLAAIVVINVAVSAAVTALMPTAPNNWQWQLVVGTIVTLLWFQVAFALVSKPERFVQTTSAFFGIYTLFVPALLPLFVNLLPYIEKQDPANPPPAMPTLLAAALGIWLLTVQVRIVRAAFEWPFFGCIIFIFGLNLGSALVYGMLFGVPPGTV